MRATAAPPADRTFRRVIILSFLPCPHAVGVCAASMSAAAVYMRPAPDISALCVIVWRNFASGRLPRRQRKMERSKPPFRADHVGSLIRPEALIKAREQAEKQAMPDAELKRIQQAAIRDV